MQTIIKDRMLAEMGEQIVLEWDHSRLALIVP